MKKLTQNKPTSYSRIYDGLNLCQITPEQHERTCDYWYLVTTHYTSLTAFKNEKALLKWLNERNLHLTKPLVKKGEWQPQNIEGSFSEECHLDYDKFYNLPSIFETRQLNNGRFTLARVTDDNGHRTIHYMNCNCKERVEYDYWESKIVIGEVSP